MILAPQDIERFIALCKENGIAMTRDRAAESAQALLSLAAAIYKPMSKEAFDHAQGLRAETITKLWNQT